jgi:hypothetical protein
MTASRTLAPLELLEMPAQCSVSDLEVLATDGHRPSTFNVEEFNAVLDNPCTFHEGGTHTVRECQQFKRAFCAPEDPK